MPHLLHSPIRSSIRQGTYRDEPGYHVTVAGRGSAFVQTREAAEHYRDKLKAGGEPTLDDFYFPGRACPATETVEGASGHTYTRRCSSGAEGHAGPHRFRY